MRAFTLNTVAQTSTGQTYPVTLTECPNKFEACKGKFYPRKHDFIVNIKGTPGVWYLTTVEERAPRTGNYRYGGIVLDYDLLWYCTNFGDVLDEVLALVEGSDRVTVAEVAAALDEEERVQQERWDAKHAGRRSTLA